MLRKRSVTLNGHRTSLSLEPAFWSELERFAKAERVSLAALIARIDATRLTGMEAGNLSSALRVFILERLKEEAALAGR